MEKQPNKKLSLEAFADLVLADDSWKEQMPEIMAQLPSVDEAMLEMAYLPEDKRNALREKVTKMQGEVGNYISALGDEMSAQRVVMDKARQGSKANDAYQRTDRLANVKEDAGADTKSARS